MHSRQISQRSIERYCKSHLTAIETTTMAATIKATVIQEDKGTLHLRLHTDKGTTYQSVTNIWLIALINQACRALPGQPAEIEITIDSAN